MANQHKTGSSLLPVILLIITIAGMLSCGTDGDKQGSWYILEDNVLTVQKDDGYYLISALAENIVKVDYSADATPGKIHAPVMDQPVDVKLKGGSKTLTLSTYRLRIEVTRSPFGVSVKDLKGRQVIRDAGGYIQDGDTTRLRLQLEDDEAIYGTGMRALPMNRRGYRFACYNTPHYGYEYGATDLNYSIPHIISSRKYILLIDNPARAVMDIGHTKHDVLEFASTLGNHVYYLITGEHYYELTESYADLTGRQPLPPLWTFGHLQSRFGYRSQAEAERIARQTRESGYPLDAMIIDLFWFSEDPQDGRMGDLRWDRNRWPDPEGMMRRWREQGIRTVTISEPFFGRTSQHFDTLSGGGLLATDTTGKTMTIPDFFFADAGLIDLFQPEARDWLWEQYQQQKALGVAGWWCDLGEPEKHPSAMMHSTGPADAVHGLYGHQWTRVFHENYLQDYVDERPFILGRAGFAGTQRFGILPWSGDVGRSWSGLRAQLPIMLGMGLSGLGYVHSDAGGFAVGERDAELYTRWMQFATFTPVFRPHGDAKVAPPEPALWPREVQAAIKPYITLRYQLLPYLYTAAWRNSQTGIPLARPLFYDWSWDRKVDSIENVYLWGPDLLVAPVLNPGETTVPVYLPSGDWIDFHTHAYYEGRQAISVPVTINDLPVFVLAGSVVPTVDPIPNTDAYRTDKLNLTYYCDQGRTSDRSSIYMDDGRTRDAYARGTYHLLEIASRQGRETTSFDLRLLGNGYQGAPAERQLHFSLIGFPRDPGSLLIDSTRTTYAWDTVTRTLTFEMPFVDQSEVILSYAEE
ncbi:MAG: glycoside hydrolase family 31 protein [Saprospiraceae bacterium]|nr:glycoside hydrolase family 31 protein [Saprospiraceae bacterium]